MTTWITWFWIHGTIVANVLYLRTNRHFVETPNSISPQVELVQVYCDESGAKLSRGKSLFPSLNWTMPCPRISNLTILGGTIRSSIGIFRLARHRFIRWLSKLSTSDFIMGLTYGFNVNELSHFAFTGCANEDFISSLVSHYTRRHNSRDYR